LAHDRRKDEMVELAIFNRGTLSRCTIFATRTTGLTLQSAIEAPIQLLLSGPLGGDAQLGSLIAEGRIDAVFFFWDPLTPQPHDVDVKALLRLAVLYDVPIACNRSSADHIISYAVFCLIKKILAGVASIFAALCYSEFSSLVSMACSAYTYG